MIKAKWLWPIIINHIILFPRCHTFSDIMTKSRVTNPYTRYWLKHLNGLLWIVKAWATQEVAHPSQLIFRMWINHQEKADKENKTKHKKEPSIPVVTDEVCGNNIIFSVTQDSLHFSLWLLPESHIKTIYNMILLKD